MKMDKEHLKYIFWITIYGVLAGFAFSTGKHILIFLGIIYLLLDVFYEYNYLKIMDTRPQVEATRKELQDYIHKAEEISEQVEKSKEEIETITENVFGFLGSDSFETVMDKVENLESNLNELQKLVMAQLNIR